MSWSGSKARVGAWLASGLGAWCAVPAQDLPVPQGVLSTFTVRRDDHGVSVAANRPAMPCDRALRELASALGWRLRWQVDALFARGVIEAWETFSVPAHPLVEWARNVEPHGRQRLALVLVGQRPRGHLLTAPLALPPHRWPGYVGPILFPSRAYLAENGKRSGDRMRSLLTELIPQRRR